MPKFEQPLSEEEKKQELPAEQSFLGKIYKSKIVRALALAAALAGGEEFVESKFFRHSGGKETTFTQVENRRIEVKEGKIVTQIEAEGPLLLHIPQMHSMGGVAETIEAGGDAVPIIQSQKRVERVLLELKSKYGTNLVFAENLDEYSLPGVHVIEESIKEAEREHASLMQLFSFIERDLPKDVSESAKAWYLYAVLVQQKKDVVELRKERDEFKSGKNVAGKFKQLFAHESQAPGTADVVIQQEEMFLHDMESERLLANDRIYLWGASMKLYLEGQIELLPAETRTANRKAYGKSLGGVEVGKDREGVALELVAGRKPSGKALIPVVYGEGHDFTAAAKEWNAAHPAHEFGLARITWNESH
jgi:hypothetical protein